MKMKYIAFLLTGVSLVGTSTAQELDKDGPICSSVLCAFHAKGGWYASITAMDVKPSETGLGQTTDSWQFATANGVTSEATPFTPKFDWGWGLTLGYDIPMSANDIEASYLQLNHKTHAVTSFANGAISFGSLLSPDAFIPEAFFPTLVSDAYLDYEVHQFDLKAGRKYSDVSGAFNLKPSIGIRYAELEHKLTFAAPGNMISEFKGAGPLFSLDANYWFNKNFDLVAYLDYSPIIGNIHSHSFVTLGTVYGFNWPKTQRIVDNTSARLGLNYQHECTKDMKLGLEVGYQVNSYANAMDTIQGVLGLAGLGQHMVNHDTSSFAFQGPYINLSFHA